MARLHCNESGDAPHFGALFQIEGAQHKHPSGH
jgi:hypothetical protein